MTQHSPGQASGAGVQERAQEVVSQAQEKARDAAAEGGGRLRAEIGTRSTEVGEQAQSLALALRRTAEDIDHGGAASLVRQLADRVDSLGGYLKESDADAMLGNLEAMARRRPWLAGGAGMAAGFLASRFLKASSGERYETARRSELARREDADAPMLRESEETLPGGTHGSTL